MRIVVVLSLLLCGAVALHAQQLRDDERFALAVHVGQLGIPQEQIGIGLSTQLIFPCANIHLAGSLTRRGTRLFLKIDSIADTDLCLTLTGRATASYPLDLPSGVYQLKVQFRGRAQVLRLVMTDSSIALEGSTGSVVIPDTRVYWRVPEQSLALQCTAGHLPSEKIPPVCTDVLAWVARLPGVEPFEFAPGGIIPYPVNQNVYDEMLFRFYRYHDPSVLPIIQRCMKAIQDQVAATVGLDIAIASSDGMQTVAWSKSSLDQPHVGPPPVVTANEACAIP